MKTNLYIEILVVFVYSHITEYPCVCSLVVVARYFSTPSFYSNHQMKEQEILLKTFAKLTMSSTKVYFWINTCSEVDLQENN